MAFPPLDDQVLGPGYGRPDQPDRPNPQPKRPVAAAHPGRQTQAAGQTQRHAGGLGHRDQLVKHGAVVHLIAKD